MGVSPLLAILLYLGGGGYQQRGPQLSKSSLICLPDGQMKARLLSMQMVVQVALQLKNDKEIFTWLA